MSFLSVIIFEIISIPEHQTERKFILCHLSKQFNRKRKIIYMIPIDSSVCFCGGDFLLFLSFVLCLILLIISQTIENETILPIYFLTSSYWHIYDFHNYFGHIWNIILITNIFHTCFVLPIIHRKIWFNGIFWFWNNFEFSIRRLCNKYFTNN